MFKYVTVLLLLALLSPQATAAGRPNIVLIMADDIGFECYSSSGSKFYRTPNIDALAQHGARFTQAYSQPICTPTRVQIMTGRHNFRNYKEFTVLDLEQPTFARMVREKGYATAVAGKWQLSAGNTEGPHQAGFDEYCLWHFSEGSAGQVLPERFKNKGSRYKSPTLFTSHGKRVEGTEGRYGPDIVSDFLCDFIGRERSEPFLVYYPMILVHNPFEPTPDSPDWEKKDPQRKTIEHFRDMVHYMDKLVGKIVDKLKASGEYENTLIMVTGDNGTNRQIASPFPGRGEIQGGKGTMVDAGNHVTFVAHWPGQIPAGTVIESPVEFTDVMATIAEVTGSDLPTGSDGISMLPLLKGNESGAREWIFQSYSKAGPAREKFRCFVRDKRWKLYADGSLFDVPHDWQEEKPLGEQQAVEVRARLQPLLEQYLRQIPAELIDRAPPHRRNKK